jgi:hypothetical protein
MMSILIDATYSAEDNKLRLYASERLDQELFERVKVAGFKWAPKQELFVAPKWTPSREDLCIELAGTRLQNRFNFEGVAGSDAVRRL